jgi:GT2 family glycosyltransferase
MDPRIAVVVASRDRRATLLAHLPRHLALPERPRVVLVDDGSSDGTAAAVRDAHPAVEVLELGRSRGAAARNAGLEHLAGVPYVALCDDDSFFAPGALARAADVLDAVPRLGLLAARILVGPDGREDPLNARLAGDLPARTGQPGTPAVGFLACAAVVRREAVLAAGGFHPRLGIGGEESLLAWDLAATGWRLSFVADVVAHHHPAATRSRPARRRREARNALWTTWLRRPPAVAAAATLQAARRDPRALADAAAGLPWVLRDRRRLPTAVEADLRAAARSAVGPAPAAARPVLSPAPAAARPAVSPAPAAARTRSGAARAPRRRPDAAR